MLAGLSLDNSSAPSSDRIVYAAHVTARDDDLTGRNMTAPDLVNWRFVRAVLVSVLEVMQHRPSATRPAVSLQPIGYITPVGIGLSATNVLPDTLGMPSTKRSTDFEFCAPKKLYASFTWGFKPDLLQRNKAATGGGALPANSKTDKEIDLI